MRVISFFFLMVFTLGAYALKFQQTNLLEKKVIVHTPALKKDSSTISIRSFDKKSIDKYSAQKEFSYTDAAPKDSGLWARFWRWFWNIIKAIFSGKTSGAILNYIVTGIFIVLAVFIAIKLTGLDYKFLAKKSEKVDVPFEESLENIHEINFDAQIEKALESLNYRLAVRLLYLKTLKLLSDRGQIIWQAEKTNQAYVSELTNLKQQEEFATLTNQFEFVWYGEFFINETSFKQIYHSFQHFNANKI